MGDEYGQSRGRLAGGAEIQQHHLVSVIFLEIEIFRFDVAVNHTGAMDHLKGVQHLPGNAHGHALTDAVSRLFLQIGFELHALDIGHDNVGRAVGLEVVQHLNDAGMIEGVEPRGLIQEFRQAVVEITLTI